MEVTKGTGGFPANGSHRGAMPQGQREVFPIEGHCEMPGRNGLHSVRPVLQKGPWADTMSQTTALFIAATLLSASCRGQSACPNGCPSDQTCSAQGVCTSPLACGRIETRLRVCAPQILERALPGRTVSSKAQRRMANRISKEVAGLCRTISRAKASKRGTKRSSSQSNHRRFQTRQWNRCLKKNSCQQFARCVLALAAMKAAARTRPIRKTP